MFLGRALMLTKGLVLASCCSGYETIVEPKIGKGGRYGLNRGTPFLVKRTGVFVIRGHEGKG